VPQAWYNAAAGVKNVVTETGAGQWGSALSFASTLFGLNCEVNLHFLPANSPLTLFSFLQCTITNSSVLSDSVFEFCVGVCAQVWQVRASYDQKPYRRLMMETWGAKVHPSPSDVTEAGRKLLAADPTSPGSLGMAISEAVEVAATNGDTKYCLGSVLNHVLLHQTVIGEECLEQLAAVGVTPDVVIGCTGGGSNFGGLAFPFMREKLAGRMNPQFKAVEPAACPTLTKGVYAYDFGDTAGMTPLMKMHTLGHGFVPDPIHAGVHCCFRVLAASSFLLSIDLICSCLLMQTIFCRWPSLPWNGTFDLPCVRARLHGGYVHKTN
jgi:tryptophan synthase beta chain